MRTSATVLISLSLAVACGAGGESSTGDDPGSPARTASQQAGAVQEAVVGDGVEPEGGEDAFVASGPGSGGTVGAADRIEGVRFQIFDDYERITIDFGKKDGEAGVPQWTVEKPEEGGYVRLRFPGVTSTKVADKDLIGDVLSEMYVVREEDGLFADVFAMHGFRYRITASPESGWLAVDFRGVPEELRFPPTTGDRVVVLRPREAEEVVSPIDVRGYARLFEGQVTVSILDRERDVVSSETVRADHPNGTWGLFETTLEFSDYEGLATLRVGGRSTQDGFFVGTETEVFLESSGPG